MRKSLVAAHEFFRRGEADAEGWGMLIGRGRDWESAYRDRWRHDKVERVADATGLPVGVKSAVGDLAFWAKLAEQMAATGAGPDFVTIDGGEGGTGAAPLTFSDHVALPLKLGMARVYSLFARAGIAEDVVFIAAGRLASRHRPARARARLRHGQCRPRGDAGDRLHPGAPAPRPEPGPEAGEHAGFPGVGDASREHMDMRSAGAGTTEAG